MKLGCALSSQGPHDQGVRGHTHPLNRTITPHVCGPVQRAAATACVVRDLCGQVRNGGHKAHAQPDGRPAGGKLILSTQNVYRACTCEVLVGSSVHVCMYHMFVCMYVPVCTGTYVRMYVCMHVGSSMTTPRTRSSMSD